MSELKRYLLVCQLKGATRNRNELTESAKTLHEIVSKISKGEFQLAFMSADAHTFGFLLKSTLPCKGIVGVINSPDNRAWKFDNSIVTGSPLLSGDGLIVLEVGEDFSAQGLGTAGSWLQHH